MDTYGLRKFFALLSPIIFTFFRKLFSQFMKILCDQKSDRLKILQCSRTEQLTNAHEEINHGLPDQLWHRNNMGYILNPYKTPSTKNILHLIDKNPARNLNIENFRANAPLFMKLPKRNPAQLHTRILDNNQRNLLSKFNPESFEKVKNYKLHVK